MKLKTESDVKRLLAKMVQSTLKEAKKGSKGALNEVMIGGLAPMGAIGGVMGLSSLTSEAAGPDNPDLIAATQFADVIADFIESNVDEFANLYFHHHNDDGSYPARVEDIGEMAEAVAQKVMHQLDIKGLIKTIVENTYRLALS